MLNWEERRMIVKAAKLYYAEGWTQAQIAKKNGVSRPVISKLLNRAKEEGIVEIYIKDKTVQTVELEQKLEKKYELKEVIVVAGAGYTSEMVLRQLGKAGASYLSKRLTGNKKIGISWGASVHALITEYPYERREQAHVVPLIGGMGNNFVHLHSNQLSFHFAQKLNTSCSYLYAPAMVESDDLKNRLTASKDIAEVLEEGRNVDIAVVGIGNPVVQSTMEKMGYIHENDIASLKKSQAVGDINSSFFDSLGHKIDHPINERVIGLNIDEIKKIPEVLAIVEGAHKINSVHAALTGGYIDVLVIDDSMAQALAEE